MSAKAILGQFRRWRDEGRRLALATVVETEGSTYSKAGHRILIAETGDYRGLVSGGCLEGDLAEHARNVIATGRAVCLTYDLRNEADELFGLGIGCNGLLRILLQRLTPEDSYEPFASIATLAEGDAGGWCVTVTESALPDLEPGASLVLAAASGAGDAPRIVHAGTAGAYIELLTADLAAEPVTRAGREAAAGVALREVVIAGQPVRVLTVALEPLPRLLVLGAGLDAVPLVNLADAVGWRVTVADHRPAYLQRADLGGASLTLCAPADELSTRIELRRFDAAVVMSHHLATDRTYLGQLARCGIPYIGLLGPAARRERLLLDLGGEARLLDGRLRGPAGLDLGADSPETIALSILAEVQAMHARRRHQRKGAQPAATPVRP